MRTAEYPVNPIFVQRRSSRALVADVKDSELNSLFEAARWAPSAFNEQPWRYLYAMHKSEEWQKMLDLLLEFNQQWAKNSGALIMLLSEAMTTAKKPNRTANFDCGASWMSFALQAVEMGLVAHAMDGFDYDLARTEFAIPERFEICAIIAVGRPGNPEDLPKDLFDKEEPNDRNPIDKFTFKGKFTEK